MRTVQPGTMPQPDVTPDADEPRLGVAAAARRLGIAPATLRTWDRRYGIGPDDHTPGRHRRYSGDDLARLELMQQALIRGAAPADAARYARSARSPRSGPVAPISSWAASDGHHQVEPAAPREDERGGRVRVGGRVLRLPGAGPRARGVGRAALALDAVTVRALLCEALAEGGVPTMWDAVVRPVLGAVADRWASTGAGVEIEHLLSECIAGVLAAHAAAAPPPQPARPVLLAAMPDELHTLPLEALGALLADRRVACRPLGADLPADALAAAIRRTAPAAVVLWAQRPSTADVALLRALPSVRPRFRAFVAGPGWQGLELPARTTWLSSLLGAAGALEAVLA
jgi:MerR family transcriptional regulator, light-induced transcriptional regulator